MQKLVVSLTVCFGCTQYKVIVVVKYKNQTEISHLLKKSREKMNNTIKRATKN